MSVFLPMRRIRATAFSPCRRGFVALHTTQCSFTAGNNSAGPSSSGRHSNEGRVDASTLKGHLKAPEGAGAASPGAPAQPVGVPAASAPPKPSTSSTPFTDDDEDGFDGMLTFSQGMKDFRWRTIPGARNACSPSLLHRETVSNRIRLFGMPKGFPDTTAAGFQRFFYLSQVSAFVSNFSSSIGYQSLLSGFFLGSSPQLWMLKDLIPALFAAYMANRVVSYENRPKFWFVVSVFMNNVTVISDMLIPSLLPNHLIAAAIVTSTVKQSSALMYFVTRASALQHYATNNNLAELTKKFNSFGMVSFTVATALGIAYCTYVASFTVQLVTVVVCCATNMFFSSMAMTPIAFRLLNFSTMKLLAHAYLTEQGRVMRPQEVSDMLGVRMLPIPALKKAGATLSIGLHLVYVSPPVGKLEIRSDTLEEDVLYVDTDEMFMLALWKPSPVPLTLRECWLRYELPALPRFLREGRWRRRSPSTVQIEEKYRGLRLTLMVHQKCSARHLITAYLIMYTAVLQHAANEAELRHFLHSCSHEQKKWNAKGDEFRELLRAADWDVQLPILDHHDFRLSRLILPPSMRRSAGRPANGDRCTPPRATSG